MHSMTAPTIATSMHNRILTMFSTPYTGPTVPRPALFRFQLTVPPAVPAGLRAVTIEAGYPSDPADQRARLNLEVNVVPRPADCATVTDEVRQSYAELRYVTPGCVTLRYVTLCYSPV